MSKTRGLPGVIKSRREHGEHPRPEAAAVGVEAGGLSAEGGCGAHTKQSGAASPSRRAAPS